MRLSEIRPCDACGGPIATGSYAVDVSLIVVNATSVNQVLGLNMLFGGALGLAEAMAPDPHPVKVVGDIDQSLRTRLVLCQSCVLTDNRKINLAVLVDARNQAKEKACTSQT